MASAAAAAVAAARRRVLDYFFAHNAVTAENAIAYDTDRNIQRRQFERMLDNGVIKETQPGRYYVDVVVWQAWRAKSKRMVLLALFALLAVMIVTGLVFGK